MASRGLYILSATLLGGTALLLWLGFGRAAIDPPKAPAAVDPGTGDGIALGVRAADYDSARRTDDEPLPSGPRIAEREPRRTPPLPVPELPPQPPAPPVAADPGLNALSEASMAAQPKVIAALRADLDARRDALRETCWPPGSDYAATFTVETTFLEDGTMVSLGISDVPGMPGVGACIIGQIGQKPPVLPEAPGVSVTAAVPLAFAGARPPPADDLPESRPRDPRG
ncbi:hypothetical protein [Nannocystis radixulma]|uniref:AgmX/PglI C-terminal domain-containing protein n=1 Tax=Nannocystis radixulma TaxID=2995305 RepID=A0ABT5AYT4_9BACT|nr:hypothetical protein [Nannocystis radixulma]MDC0666383.1 hypothetical protein [Nannocystis radixulma]